MQDSKKKNETGANLSLSAKGSHGLSRSMPPVSPARQAQLDKMADMKAVLNERETLQFFEEKKENDVMRGKLKNNAKAGTTKPRSARRAVPKRPTPNFAGATSSGAASALHSTRMKIRRERMSKFDYPFFTIVIVLLCFGTVMMFSSSYAYAHRAYGDSYHFVSNQLRFIGLGMIVMLLLSVIDYQIFRNKLLIKLGAVISVGLMLLVKIIGTTQGGAERWLDIGGVTIQPSELLKFAVIVVLAYFGHVRYSRLKELQYGFLPFMLCLITACGLTAIQPHLSGTIIIFAIGVIMMFVSDCKVSHIVIMLLVFALLGVILIAGLRAIGYDYMSTRILSWQDPEADIRNKTFQTYQSLVTIGSGGMFGLGLGNSRQKYAYLPASHNDFIFSVVCEELGFIGAMLVILLFVLFIFRGFFIAARARDKFGMLLVAGITSHLGIQALLNIAVVTNSIPNTGISLPFFSYGGTALVMQLAEIGVVLNVSRKASLK